MLLANLGSGDHSRYSHHIHLTLSRDGGASGSAPWNIDGKMVGLHSGGVGTESYEVRIDYIKDALEQLQEENTPKRGDIFVQLDTVGLATATGTWGYPKVWAEQGIQENKNIHYALQIKRLIDGTDAAKKIQVGDFVLAIKGHDKKDFINVGYSLYTFDKVVDQSVGGYVTLKMYRQGKGKKPEDNIFDVQIEVKDAHQYLPKRFIRFAGAIFHDLTPSILFFYGGAFNDGVFLNSAEAGTTFDALGGRLYKGSKQTEERAMVIKKVNNQKIHSLQNFIDLVKEFSNGESFSVVFNDSQDYNPTDQAKSLQLYTGIEYPLSIYYWNEDRHMWELDNN
ncbi:MAG: hypothetical protein R3A45_02095 [Bdellovibrionota bacterium]